MQHEAEGLEEREWENQGRAERLDPEADARPPIDTRSGRKLRVLSGVQPSGRLHLGNWFGAIRQHLRLQEEGHRCFYFVANYHALTSLQDRAAMEESTLHVVFSYLALGLDPERSVFFLQSDVPQVTELCWILNTLCPVTLMRNATSYKDKVARGLNPNMGLFDYPVLQAADILIYDSDLVPVGQDQKQHIEITRDLAIKLNLAYGDDLLIVPEPYILPEVAVVPGLDGQKMSKSYNNTIELFTTPEETLRRCRQIVTDSTPLENPKDPSTCNVYSLLRLMAEPAEAEEIAERYRRGGYGYGTAKTRLAELINQRFEEPRRKYAELVRSPERAYEVLEQGARVARETAERTMVRIRKATGILTSSHR